MSVKFNCFTTVSKTAVVGAPVDGNADGYDVEGAKLGVPEGMIDVVEFPSMSTKVGTAWLRDLLLLSLSTNTTTTTTTTTIRRDIMVR